MMRRIVVMLIAMSCTAAMVAPLACGKYGKPVRVAQQGFEAQQQPETSELALHQDSDDEARKNGKP